jgi:SAM-dependent methyltransferase
MDDPDLLAAYISYYWHVSYAQAGRVMAHCAIIPGRVLDLGCGPGPMSAAALDRGALALTLLDHSAAALQQATERLASVGRSIPLRTIQADLLAQEALPPGPFDLVIMGHCLNEIGQPGCGRGGLAAGKPDSWHIEIRAGLVRRAASRLAPGGRIMIIEPATLVAARDGMALRDRLCAQGWTIAGPCPAIMACPALAAGPTHSCHDEADWDMPAAVGRLAAAAGLDRAKIKMFWLVVSPPTLGGLDVVSPPAPGRLDVVSASDWPCRVVSEPLLNKAGRIRYLLCGRQGRFPFSAKKDDPQASQAGFFGLQRYDLIRVVDPEPREGGWGCGPGTRIVVLTRQSETATMQP